MAHLIDTMAYTGQPLGTSSAMRCQPNKSIETWTEAAGMNWSIHEAPVRFMAVDKDAGAAGLYGEAREFPEPKVGESRSSALPHDKEPLSVVGTPLPGRAAARSPGVLSGSHGALGL